MRHILVISRQFGSGGRELAQALGQELDLPVYDQEQLASLAKEEGLDPDWLFHCCQREYHPFGQAVSSTLPLVHMTRIFRCLAAAGDCILVGHGAAEMVDAFHPFSVYVMAGEQSRIDRIRQREGQTGPDKAIRKRMQEVDKGRAYVHHQLSGTIWGDPANYHLVINTTDIPVHTIAPGLARIIRNWWETQDEHQTV